MKTISDFREVISENRKYEIAGMFKILSNNEVEEFKLWAQNNYEKGTKINPAWHPVIVTKCILINLSYPTKQEKK